MIFALGACMGSFFNVCIYRIPKRVPLSMPPSHCYQCGQPLRWHDNIPLLSYWILGGRCRYCRAPYSIRYFAIELLTAALWLGVFLRYCGPEKGYSLVVIPGVIFMSLLVVAAFTDIDHWIIPDRVSLGGAAAGLALAAAWPVGLAPGNPLAGTIEFIRVPERFIPLANAVIGAAFGYGLLWTIGALGTLAFRKEAMGQGDMKLFALFGAFAGPMNSLFILILACVIGSAIGLFGYLAAALRPARVDPAVAALEPNALRCEEYLRDYDLTSPEALVLTRALTSPGVVGPVRHHLPFGPSLAIAAAAVYLFWQPIEKWFFATVLGEPW